MDDDNYFTVGELTEAAGLEIGGNMYDDHQHESEEPHCNVNSENSMQIQDDNSNNINNNDIMANSNEEELEPVRKRSKRSPPQTWMRNKKKLLRMKGLSYKGIENKDPVEKLARVIGSTCNSSYCSKSKFRFCQLFTEEERMKIFSNFWNDLNWNEKKVYVKSLVDKINVKTKRTSDTSRRETSFIYTLKINAEKKQVCQKMFVSTLGIGKNQMFGWLSENESKTQINVTEMVENPERENYGEAKIFLCQYLDDLPKLPSHYTRKDTMKMYLEPIINSKSELYRLYQAKCNESSVKSLSRCTMHRELEKKNISIFPPKKDQCDICTAYKSGNITEVEYNIHQAKKQEARTEKTADKILAGLGKCHAIVIDLESVKLCPYLKASALYYKSKLAVHNFTVYDLATKECKCYWWDQTEGDLLASTFASCLIDFFQRYTDDLEIIVYSDGCGYQNRNVFMSTGLLNYASDFSKVSGEGAHSNGV